MKLNTRDIVYIGFIAALCAVATTIRVEIPGGAWCISDRRRFLRRLFYSAVYMADWARLSGRLYLIYSADIRNTSYFRSLSRGG